MTFLLHFGFPGFLKELARGSIVCSAAYAFKDQPTGTVLLTSDAGITGGTIHALQMTITGDTSGGLALAVEASDKIESFLVSKGMKIRVGILLTSGLQEALRYWGSSSSYSLIEVRELLEQREEVALK
jgi:hypothetical protein